MRKDGFLAVVNSLIIIIVGISFNSCFLMRTTSDFKQSDHIAFFSKDYNPNVNNQLKDGIYLRYDESCRKFLNGPGFFLYPDGRVEETKFYLDYLNLDDATQENIKRLLDEDFFLLSSPSRYNYSNEDGIYTVKGNKLFINIYPYFGLKDWGLRKSEYDILDDVTVMPIESNSDVQNRIVYRCIPYPIPEVINTFSAKRQKWLWDNKEDWKEFKKSKKN